jgi:hypothetical protein
MREAELEIAVAGVREDLLEDVGYGELLKDAGATISAR